MNELDNYVDNQLKNSNSESNDKLNDKLENKFEFNSENLSKINSYMNRYPKKRSGILWCLHIAQNQNGGHLNDGCIEAVSRIVDISPAQVKEVASFYKMFRFYPTGKNIIQVCTSLSCWLRGSDEILKAFLEYTDSLSVKQVSPDKLFTIEEICCLGNCSNAPSALVNDIPHEDLTKESVKEIINTLRKGEMTTPGSQIGRICSSKYIKETIDGTKWKLKDRNK